MPDKHLIRRRDSRERIGGELTCCANDFTAAASTPRMESYYCQTTDWLVDAGWEIGVKADMNE